MRSVLSMFAALLLLAGCGAGTDAVSTPQTTPGADASESLTPAPVETTPVMPEEAGTPTSESSPAPTEPSPATDEDEPMDSSTAPPDDVSARLADDAVADLAERLQVSATTIEVLRNEPVTWSDGSLGCPKPGETYTQAQVDGYRLVLQHASRVYLYHAGGDGPAFLCPSDDKDGGRDFVPPPGFHE